MDNPGEAEKLMGGQGHGHQGGKDDQVGKAWIQVEGTSGHLYKQVKEKLPVRSV